MPRSQVIQEGKKLVLSCHTRGLLDMRYRWVKDDVEIPEANRPDLVLEPVRMHDFGCIFAVCGTRVVQLPHLLPTLTCFHGLTKVSGLLLLLV